MDRIVINGEDKILIIAPHPDDESIGLGGLLAIYGKQCDVWVMTDGSGCKMDGEKAEIAKIRKEEFVQAMNFCGVFDYRFLGIEDKYLSRHLDVLNGADVGMYTKIFVPGSHEAHIDHVAAHDALMNMLEYQKITDKEIYCYEITSPMHQFNYALDISGVIDKKRQCISMYRSQTEIFDYLQAASSLNCFRACMMGLFHSYAEVYNRIDRDPCRRQDGRCRMELEKYKKMTHLLQKWVKTGARHSSIGECLKKQNINSVSVYGYGLLGRLLCEMLSFSPICVVCVIDRKFTDENEKFISPDREIPKTDAVILTVLFEHDKIRDGLYEKGHHKVVLLEELIDAMEEEMWK